jgi:putative heme degradation protein
LVRSGFQRRTPANDQPLLKRWHLVSNDCAIAAKYQQSRPENQVMALLLWSRWQSMVLVHQFITRTEQRREARLIRLIPVEVTST